MTLQEQRRKYLEVIAERLKKGDSMDKIRYTLTMYSGDGNSVNDAINTYQTISQPQSAQPQDASISVGGQKFQPQTYAEAQKYQETQQKNEMMKSSATQDLNTKLEGLNSLISDPEGLKNAVGTGSLGRGADLPFNLYTDPSRAKFAGTASKILTTETLDTLINAKAEGATFGALSEGELALLRQSASVLNSWAIKDKDGKVTGFQASEADVKAELEKMKKATEQAVTSLNAGTNGQQPQGAQGQQDPKTIFNATLQHAQQNPNDPQAQKFLQMVSSGQIDPVTGLKKGEQSPLDANAAPESGTTSAAPEQKGFIGTLGSEIVNFAGSAKDRLGAAMTDVSAEAKKGNAPSLFGRAGLRAAGVIGGTINDAFMAMTKVGFAALPDAQQKALKDTANTAINSETGKAAISALQAGSEKWNAFKEANPVAAKDIEDAANVFAAIPAAKTISGAKNLALDAKTLAVRAKDAAVGAVKGQEQYVTKAADNAFRAIKPTLTVGRDKMAARSVVSTAMQEVANQGIVPTNLRTFAEGLTQTKQAVWKNIEASIGGGKNLQVDVQSIADELTKMAQSSTLSMADRTAATKIGQMAQNLVSNGGKISVPDAELLKQYLNGELKGAFGKFNMSAAEVNAKKMITAKIGEQLDSLLSSVPGEFSSLKKTYGALRQTEEDVMKRLITFERQNPQGLIESFGKISGIGNVLKGVVTANPGEILKGAAEFTMGKIQQAANNSDLLIKKSFELLNKGKGSFEPRSSILKKLMSGSAGLSATSTDTITGLNEAITQTTKNLELATKRGVNKATIRKLNEQLDALYKQRANLGSPAVGQTAQQSPLLQEAGKYETPEEFVKASVYSPARDSQARGVLRKEIEKLATNKKASSLVENADNPAIDKSTVNIKAEDIRDGKRPYILVEGNKIVDGHHAYRAYLKEGIEDIPVVDKSQLTDLYNKAQGGVKKNKAQLEALRKLKKR